MKTDFFPRASRIALLSFALGVTISAANAQPASSPGGTAMPGGMNKSMPMMGNDAGKGMGGGMGAGMGSGMDMKPMMMDMQQKMSAMKSSGNVDIDFAMMMRVHHQSAVTMAEAELQNGKDPQMRVMAMDIIRAQKKEIAVFDKFLAKQRSAGMKMDQPGPKMNK